ncbi:response regulator [Streptomyces sp. NPDC041068]|uniref:response regulator n=1 Tax=Streptomyces sp. NPDC041068 TaxID=3155130 RepID=UPI0033F952DB
MPENSKILVVDDHEDTLFALESALAPLHCEVIRATSGEQALKEILRGDVGLMLLDLRMPGVSGLDVVRYTRRLEQTQYIPIILLTGFGVNREVSVAAFQLGVADVVMKPIDPLPLCTKVRYLHSTYQQLRALRQEVHDLKAKVAAMDASGARPSAFPGPGQAKVVGEDGGLDPVA